MGVLFPAGRRGGAGAVGLGIGVGGFRGQAFPDQEDGEQHAALAAAYAAAGNVNLFGQVQVPAGLALLSQRIGFQRAGHGERPAGTAAALVLGPGDEIAAMVAPVYGAGNKFDGRLRRLRAGGRGLVRAGQVAPLVFWQIGDRGLSGYPACPAGPDGLLKFGYPGGGGALGRGGAGQQAKGQCG